MFATFRRFSRLMAVAVGEGACVDTKQGGVLEADLEATARLTAAIALLIWDRASWVLIWANWRQAACCPIKRELPGSPPIRGLKRGPGIGGGPLRPDGKPKLKKVRNRNTSYTDGLDVDICGWSYRGHQEASGEIIHWSCVKTWIPFILVSL